METRNSPDSVPGLTLCERCGRPRLPLDWVPCGPWRFAQHRRRMRMPEDADGFEDQDQTQAELEGRRGRDTNQQAAEDGADDGARGQPAWSFSRHSIVLTRHTAGEPSRAGPRLRPVNRWTEPCLGKWVECTCSSARAARPRRCTQKPEARPGRAHRVCSGWSARPRAVARPPAPRRRPGECERSTRATAIAVLFSSFRRAVPGGHVRADGGTGSGRLLARSDVSAGAGPDARRERSLYI